MAFWAVGSALVAWVTETGIQGWLTLQVLGAVLALGFDNRRRSIRLQALGRQSARATRVADRTRRSVERSQRRLATSMRNLTRQMTDGLSRNRREFDSSLADSTRAVARYGQAVDDVQSALDRGFSSLSGDLATSRREASSASSQILTSIPKIADLRTLTRAELLTLYKQVEANFQLRDITEVSGPTPALRGWAASPDVIVFLTRELRRTRPSVVVECGSGASTVWMAMAARTAGIETRIVALEHEAVYAAETRRLLVECGVDHLAEVRDAPLVPLSIPDYDGPWYDRAALEDLHDIGLMFVDGPPGITHPMARFPALPLMREQLSPTATVVLDDLIRDEEQSIAELWTDLYPEFSVERIQFEKGAAAFRLGPTTDE